ncbi:MULTISPECIES: alternative ribosome rescue aminoacyl-tRNA hydrolase ArfB [Maribellus]|uniref:Aminoacyl-tRNA hydrolase n=1 Tax=Maribellus comscasis TaxID=2681766 RepID=A0A6I6JJ33_9BACT|nr:MULTISPECIES: alternative ribosome rescue aminoacyl-tRNA hydrolase ArfB [Maribellus]MCG6188333.1 aminoacyl-tRNA hydrolase [Maribellus maritimus]QGY42281.1 aminoacyl-tRNA hydrolase [Maribellus comscasis]
MIFSEEIIKRLENECTYSATRSSGPGGQNVNKVNTRVELRFPVNESSVFSEKEKDLIRQKLGNRINSESELLLFSESERSQLANRKKVFERFILLVKNALTPKKKRIKTSPTAGSKQKRLEKKKINAQKKQLRKPPEI